MDKKIIGCSCGWAFHSLVINPEVDGQFPDTSFYIVNAPADLTFWLRLKEAWLTLIGKEHVLSEIIISRDDMPELVEYITSLALNPDTSG